MKKRELVSCLEFHCDCLMDGKGTDGRYELMRTEVNRLFTLLETDRKALKKEITTHFKFDGDAKLAIHSL